MGDAGGELAEGGELFGLYQAILCRPQILQRFRQLAGAGFNTLEQPHILDGNGRLVGKRRDQLNFPVGKRLDSLPRKGNDTNRFTFPHEGNTDHRPNLCNLGIPLLLIQRVRHRVDDPNNLFLNRGSSHHRSRPRYNRCSAFDFHIPGIDAISGRKSIDALVQPEYDGRIGMTEAGRGIDHALKNWLQIEF